MDKWFQIDERAERVSDRLAFLFLSLTHFALFTAMFIQRYIFDRPPDYYNDVTIILFLSWLGYWGARFYFGGILPVLSFQKTVVIYICIVLFTAVPYTLIRGFPEQGEWLKFLAILLGGPAVVVGFLATLAYFGNQRVERSLTS